MPAFLGLFNGRQHSLNILALCNIDTHLHKHTHRNKHRYAIWCIHAHTFTHVCTLMHTFIYTHKDTTPKQPGAHSSHLSRPALICSHLSLPSPCLCQSVSLPMCLCHTLHLSFSLPQLCLVFCLCLLVSVTARALRAVSLLMSSGSGVTAGLPGPHCPVFQAQQQPGCPVTCSHFGELSREW